MKKIIILILALGINISISNAQWQTMKGPSGQWINCIAINGENIFAGTSQAGIYLSKINQKSWSLANNGLFKTSITNLLSNGTNIFSIAEGEVYFSTNNGTTWSKRSSVPVSIGAITLHIDGANIYVGTSNGIYKSNNNAISWQKLVAGGNVVRNINAKGNTIIAGVTSDHGVLLSTNNGITWTIVKSIFENIYVNSITFSGTNIFAGTSGEGVFISKDNGSNWTSVNIGFESKESKYINCFDSFGDIIFAGTYDGVYLTMNNGASWTPVNKGFEDKQIISCLTLNDSNIFAGTNDGVWKRSLNDILLEKAKLDTISNKSEIISTDGLVAFYPFNGNANDESGNGNNGVVNSATLCNDKSGNALNAYHFDGNDDYITIDRNVSDNFSICFWFRTTKVGVGSQHYTTSHIITSEYPDLANDFGIGVDMNGKLCFGLGGDSDYNISSNENVNTNEWIFCCVTREKESRKFSIFINGVYSNSGIGSSNSLNSNSKIKIGYSDDTPLTPFNGTIDDIRIYNRVLSESEIHALYIFKTKE